MQGRDIHLNVDGIIYDMDVEPIRMPATHMGLPYYSVSFLFESSSTTVNLTVTATTSVVGSYQPVWGVHSLKLYTTAFVASTLGAFNYIPVVKARVC
jgi:hypothetical protein